MRAAAAAAAAAAATGILVGAATVATRSVVDQAGPGSLAMLRYLVGLLCLLPAVALMVSPLVVQAFEFSGAGAQIGLVDPEGGDGAPAVGAHLQFSQPGTEWRMRPSMLFWDSNRMNGLSFNFDLDYGFVSSGSATSAGIA